MSQTGKNEITSRRRQVFLALGGFIAFSALVGMCIVGSRILKDQFVRSTAEDIGVFLIVLPPYFGGLYLFSYGYVLYDAFAAFQRALILGVLGIVVLSILGIIGRPYATALIIGLLMAAIELFTFIKLDGKKSTERPYTGPRACNDLWHSTESLIRPECPQCGGTWKQEDPKLPWSRE